MIPTRTLRERITTMVSAYTGGDTDAVVQNIILAIGDPCLIKTAYSLEPTFTLRAQDKLAAGLLSRWIGEAQKHDLPKAKLIKAKQCLDAFRAWPTRKWPD